MLADDESTVADVVLVNTYGAPTLTTVSPATGVKAGGTSVTLTGTLFHAAARVWFGNTEAASVVVAGATSITAVSPAHAAGTYDVTVENFDGQLGTAADAFTFT
jgi:hypothetical protein